jgi:hypothetical protein
MTAKLFNRADREQMERLGIPEAAALRQLAIFTKGPSRLTLHRPCTIGDGIEVLTDDDHERLLARWNDAANQGRLSEFIPASGAATRLFAFLERVRKRSQRVNSTRTTNGQGDADRDHRDLQRFINSLEEFALFEPLAQAMAAKEMSLQEMLVAGEYTEILNCLLEPQGLNYGSLPKVLIPFHRYPDHNRTPLEEHLTEANETVRDSKQRSRVHFTVAPESEEKVRNHAQEAAAKRGKLLGVSFQLSISIQTLATNTIAVDLLNQPFRRPDGDLLFRPGGHGALLENLNQLHGDIVFIKNVDNVVTDEHRDLVVHYRRLLAGKLLEVQDVIFHYLRLLHSHTVSPGELDEMVEFVAHRLNVSLSEDFPSLGEAEKVSLLFQQLNRPLRVCGMVKNRGEPGGGPFWVQESSGRLSLQIVEGAQVDQGSPEQAAVFAASTHFNPVQLVCALADFQGRPFDLRRFVDAEAVFIARKSEYGGELKVLELPGLWNGSMAHWNTVFVEIPEQLFNPVKTINDLLRPGHRVEHSI